MQKSEENEEVRTPVPPFTEETARQKVKAAQDAWNTRDPEKVALAYTEDSKWRNRDEFFEGREAIRDFLPFQGPSRQSQRTLRHVSGQTWAHLHLPRDSRVLEEAVGTASPRGSSSATPRP